MRGASTLGAVAVLLGMLPAAIAGQADPLVEGRMLRSASSLESRGDYTGAERVLRELMDASPTSTGGLFALERVLRAQGRLIDVLPTVRAFLTVEPGAAAPRILELRVLSDADSLEALEAAARDWTRTDPRSADVYREIARAFAPVFGEDRALEVLLSGREALDEPSAFAMEIGDLHRELGELDAAVREWSRAVGADGAQVAAVTRRLQALPGEVGELARPLVRSLGAEPTTVARRRAGARIALEVGLEEEALTLAASAEAELAGQTRRGFLADLARRAEDREANRLALWAYESLRDQSAGASEIRSLDQRIAAIALAQGDTSKALKARERVAAALGSAQARTNAAGRSRTCCVSSSVEIRWRDGAGSPTFAGSSPKLPSWTSSRSRRRVASRSWERPARRSFSWPGWTVPAVRSSGVISIWRSVTWRRAGRPSRRRYRASRPRRRRV